jgi:sortase (surface protein transpeptidase)
MRIVIPKIGVNAPVRALGLNADGSLQVPTDFSTVGWWSGGAYPGDLGPAVYDGHVSSTSGPAVFARLDELAPGDRIEISSPTGGLVTFKVTSSQQVAKSSFPTAAVYGWTPDPQIRLITCGGQFNTSTGHFYDNLIVYGVLSSR